MSGIQQRNEEQKIRPLHIQDEVENEPRNLLVLLIILAQELGEWCVSGRVTPTCITC